MSGSVLVCVLLHAVLGTVVSFKAISHLQFWKYLLFLNLSWNLIQAILIGILIFPHTSPGEGGGHVVLCR